MSIIEKTHMLSKFQLDTVWDIELSDKNDEWFNELLTSFEADTQIDKDDDFPEGEKELIFNGTVVRKKHPKYGDFLLIDGALEGTYLVNCVNTLKLMHDSFSIDIKAALLSDRFESEFEEETDIVLENELHELFFYEKNRVVIGDVLSELFYLNRNPYPKLESLDSKEPETLN